MQPYAMSSPAYAPTPNFPSMPYANSSGCATPEMNNSPIGCFGMKPPATDCFTKMGHHRPHHGGHHRMGRQHEGYMGNYNNFSMFGSQQSQFAIQGKYADANCGTGMMPPPPGCSGNGATGVPDFVREMMNSFSQAGMFGFGGQSFPTNYAGGTPYAPIDASTLPAYQGYAPSPYMGGYDLSSTTPPPPPVPSTDLYGATAPAYSAPIDSSFISQYLAGVGGQYGAGNLGDLTSQYPQLGLAPLNYAPVAPQQYAV